MPYVCFLSYIFRCPDYIITGVLFQLFQGPNDPDFIWMIRYVSDMRAGQG
jgi:hypothetical protein